MERIAIYLRKSRAEDQAGLAETLEKHRKTLLEFARTHHMIIDENDIFEEVVSGESLFARPQMLALLEAVEAERYDAVLCMDIDRLGRGGMRDQGVILDTFKYSNTKIITPEKTYDLNNEIDETTTELKTFISRQEYKAIRKRLQRGLRQTISEGGYVANAPYGYVKITQNKKPTLEINEDEAYFVRMIFDMYVNQGLGSVVIADTLNSLGASPHRTSKFGRSSVAQILKNPVYIGKIRWEQKKHIRKGQRGNDKHLTIYQPPEKWIVVEGLHPPIIDETLFTRAQEIMAARVHPPSNAKELKNPMAGLIRCQVCGALMQRLGKNPDEKYILCPTRGCVAGAKVEFVEQALIENLQDELHKIEVSLPDAEKNDTTGLEKALSATRAELMRLASQKENLYDLLEQGAYDIPTFKMRMQAVQEKIDAASQRERSQVAEIERVRKADKRKLAEELRNVLEVYDAANVQRRNDLLKGVVESIEYYKAKRTAPRDFQLFVHLRQF